jgi:hypothetical protein
MASNEHAFLSEANLHNPKGLSLASNNSVCSKDDSGLLAWKPNSFLKVDTAILEGYCDLTGNYQFPSNYTNNNKAPYQINRDYGSTTITSTPSIAQNTFFKVASFVAARDAVVNGGILQVIASGTGNFTVAIVKHTPSTTAQLAYPVVLSEKIVAGLGNANLVNSYPYNIPLDFANTAITAGDRVFIMLKGSEGGELGEVSVCATIEIGYIS